MCVAGISRPPSYYLTKMFPILSLQQFVGQKTKDHIEHNTLMQTVLGALGLDRRMDCTICMGHDYLLTAIFLLICSLHSS